jgi:hypothetical protein
MTNDKRETIQKAPAGEMPDKEPDDKKNKDGPVYGKEHRGYIIHPLARPMNR